jgi:tRNA (guanine37-N1)-methyltransferase
MLRIDAITIFPRMIQGLLEEGIVRRAIDRKLVEIGVHNLRDHTTDRHRSVDDAPFGGGPGMVMKVEPFYRAVANLLPDGSRARDAIVLLSPRGRPFRQATAERFAGLDRIILLCGRYEGVDERVATGLATEELSIGDFVLTGGEAAALAVIEATVRLLPEALGDAESAQADSFSTGLLDHPHYTRPAVWQEQPVPEVLLSGDHERVRRWRRREALKATAERRPEILERAVLTTEDRELLAEISPAGLYSMQDESGRPKASYRRRQDECHESD